MKYTTSAHLIQLNTLYDTGHACIFDYFLPSFITNIFMVAIFVWIYNLHNEICKYIVWHYKHILPFTSEISELYNMIKFSTGEKTPIVKTLISKTFFSPRNPSHYVLAAVESLKHQMHIFLFWTDCWPVPARSTFVKHKRKQFQGVRISLAFSFCD